MINVNRILQKLDEHLSHNDYSSAERHLLYWLEEASGCREEIPLLNELMGLYRKQNMEIEAEKTANSALEKISVYGVEKQIAAATTYLNCATVFKAFGKAEKALPLFQRRQKNCIFLSRR